MFTARWAVFFGVALAMLWSGGCTPTMQGLRVDKSFTYPALAAGKLAVGGVVSIGEAGEGMDGASMARTFHSQLVEERDELSVLPYGEVVNRVGEAAMERMAGEYRKSTLTPASLAELKGKLDGARYVMFARIETNTTRTNRRVEDVMREERDRQGRVTRVPTGDKTVYSTASRTLTSSADVFDLQRGRSVWSGSLTMSRDETSTYDNPAASGLIQIIQVARGESTDADSRFPFPPPPSTQHVLTDLLNGLAQNLPEE